ncbi:MAG TPA: transcriptional regulator GcvA [Candidatus Sulfotelmatobacter sp.]|nr:transcriptional regulator GcvA [Candidatus Sulfotelmatobacter sp.]
MARPLPSLNALRAFEAAARHGSFTRAALELGVTHGAVSRQVQALEARLGRPLFRRFNRRIELTDAGAAYRTEIGGAFDRIAAATARFAEDGARRVLHVTALPTFTIRWLIPRLSDFQIRNPQIEVRLTTASEQAESLREPFDVIIRGGPERWSGFRRARFLDEGRIPVCSPSLLKRTPLRRPEDLRHHTLLHSATLRDVWPKWLAAAGIADLAPAADLVFEHFYLSIQAAVDGLGVAMGPLTLVAEDLAHRRLVLPFGAPVLPGRGYYMYVPETRHDPTVELFCQWLARAGAAFAQPGPLSDMVGRQTGRR